MENNMNLDISGDQLEAIIKEAERREKEEQRDVHQELMDKAYADERKRTDADGDKNAWCYTRMVNEASELERLAVVLGNLNYQVENGGFNQWVDNGYCTNISDVKDALELIDTETTKKILPMIEKVEEFLLDSVIDGNTKAQGCGGWYIDDEKCGYEMDTCYECGGSGEVDNPDYDPEDEDSYEDEMIECCDCMGDGEVEGDVDYPNFNGDYRCEDLNTQFYAINEQFLKDIKSYIEAELGGTLAGNGIK